jgi:hypothetical protein
MGIEMSDTTKLRPCMTREEFEGTSAVMKSILACNVIGCKNPVSNYGMICVDHYEELEKEGNIDQLAGVASFKKKTVLGSNPTVATDD